MGRPAPVAEAPSLVVEHVARVAGIHRVSLMLDGYDRSGTRRPGGYLLSAFASRRGAVLAQVAIGERENELTQALPLLRQIDLNDVLATGDALFAQRALCKHIVDQGGEYLFKVKDNQVALRQALQRSFATTIQAVEGARTIDGGHGRIDIRTLHA